MPLVKEPNTEPIPGYRLVEFLGRGGFGEVWKCEAPGGLVKALKIVQGDLHALDAEGLPAEQEWKALQLVKTIRHPFLLGIDRVEVLGGELVVVMELADRSLADAVRDCRGAGQPGLPRAELLSYLREAAEALDVINLQHHLQHLDVKPGNLFLVNRHVKVGDFGLLSRMCDGKEPASQSRLAGLTPLYCAPETLTGTVSGRSDQYSLAVVYQELLTGKLPFTGRNPRELMVRRATSDPDLSALPDADRAVVARALAREPAARYHSCTEFVRALAPELMPLNSSPFLDGLLTEGAATVPLVTGSTGTRPLTANRTLPLPRDPDGPKTPRFGRRSSRRRAPDSAARGHGFAGHLLVKCLARGPLCETWKVEAPDGRARVLKFPTGLGDGSDPAGAEVLRFLGARPHAGLQPAEVLKHGARVALACDPPEGTLLDRLQHCQTVGLPGVPRQELLDHLRGAAATLDALYHDEGLQHLCLSPRALLLDGGRLLIADMGLGQLAWLPAGHPLGQINGRYSAPELCAGEVSPACDQYSLAVIYQELLTGTSPFRGGGRGKGRPSLDLLPAHDREPIARALNPDPERRFATCAELIEALDRGGAATAAGSRRASILLAPVVASPVSGATSEAGALPDAPPLIGELFGQAAGRVRPLQAGGVNYFLDPGRRLTHACSAYLSASLARLKLAGFQQQWAAEVVSFEESAVVLVVPLSGTFWQRCLGRQPAVQVRVSLTSPRMTAEVLTAVRITIRPLHCRPDQAEAVLAQFGPPLLHDLRTFLQAEPERRAHARLPFSHPVGLFPVLDGQKLGDPLVCQGKDLSLGGIALFAPEAPPTGHLYVQSLLTPRLAGVALLGRVVRVAPVGDGRYEISAAFAVQPESFIPARADGRTGGARP